MFAGFIPGSRASFMLDVVSIAMFLILPLLLVSVRLVRKKKYSAHKKIQITVGAALILTVSIFEVDVRINGWRHLAEASPYYHTFLFPFLYCHIVIAVTTFILWIITLLTALRRFQSIPIPCAHSAFHIRFAKFTVLFTFLTSFTGWCFYYLAFVA